MPRARRGADPRLLVAIGGSLLYPIVVYFLLGQVPAAALVGLALALAALRLTVSARGRPRRIGLAALGGLAALLLACLAVDPAFAAKAYPSLASLGVAALFAWSLAVPPTIVERMARRFEPEFPPEAIVYTRNVTWVWLVFLIANAAIAAGLAAFASLAAWTLWTGLASYAAMGLLFAGEWLVRRRFRRRHRPARSAA